MDRDFASCRACLTGAQGGVFERGIVKGSSDFRAQNRIRKVTALAQCGDADCAIQRARVQVRETKMVRNAPCQRPFSGRRRAVDRYDHCFHSCEAPTAPPSR
jgi:hypothetical protein